MSAIESSLAVTADDRVAGWRRLTQMDYLLAIVVALAGAFVCQVWPARIDLNLGDEGLLWYGVQQVLAGHWPRPDFQPYDPGRFLLLAAWARLCHDDGIVTLRYGQALLQIAAMIPATLLLLRALPNRALAIAFACVAGLWMGPRHKMIDVTASVWMTFFLAWMVARPTSRRHFLAGVQIGLLWWIGRNHALYAAVAAGAIIVFQSFSERVGARALLRRAGWCVGGIAAGSIPMLLALGVVPGLATEYWQNAIARFVRLKTTNLPLPIPWPWTAADLIGAAVGLGFIVVPAAVAVAMAILVLQMRRGRSLREFPILLSAAACAALETHHMFSRADLAHLAQAGFPAVLLLAALPGAFIGYRRIIARGLAWGALALVTLGAMPGLSPLIAAWQQPEAKYAWGTVGHDRLFVPLYTRRVCAVAADVVRQMRPGETAIFVPYVPGLYAVFHLECPMGEAYPILPETLPRQGKIIAALEARRTDWAMVWPDRIDGRGDLGFDRTHELVYRYLMEHFEPVNCGDAPGNVLVLRRRD